MAIVQASGTTTPILNVETTLADLTTPFATFLLIIDLSPMQLNDTTILRAYTKVLVTSTLASNSVLFQTFTDAPTGNGDQVVISAPITSDQEILYTLTQTTGTARSYVWKVISL